MLIHFLFSVLSVVASKPYFVYKAFRMESKLKRQMFHLIDKCLFPHEIYTLSLLLKP